jgi:FAD/FMN-containing dehydrogenase
MPISRREFIQCALSTSAAASFQGRFATLAAPWGNQPSPLDRLRASLKGQLILPTDLGYDSARRVWSFNPQTDLRPSVIARCADATDVQKAIRFAREQGLEIAVRSGGHDIRGASVCDRGVVIDLSTMKNIEMDATAQIAHAASGVLSGELSRTTAAADLAPVLGCNPGVGIGGLTLGGGFGFLLGTHGASCDNLLAAQIVTADGELLQVTADEHPDLFWAVRGGGGNFGVATDFTFRVHKIESLFAGVVAYRVNDVAPFLRFYRDFMVVAPDELVSELSIFPSGETITIWALTVWNGDSSAGERALRPLRSFETPAADTIERVPLRRLFYRMPPRGAQPLADSTARRPAHSQGLPNTYWRGGSAATLSDSLILNLSSALAGAPPGWQLGLGHYLHGLASRVPETATPLRRPRGQCTYFLSASWATPDGAAESMRWVDGAWRALETLAQTPTYVNYLSVDSEDAVRATYGANYDRLVQVKRAYDPHNVFHRNRNIRP